MRSYEEEEEETTRLYTIVRVQLNMEWYVKILMWYYSFNEHVIHTREEEEKKYERTYSIECLSVELYGYGYTYAFAL